MYFGNQMPFNGGDMFGQNSYGQQMQQGFGMDMQMGQQMGMMGMQGQQMDMMGGYGMNNMQPVRYSKQQIIQGLRDYVVNNTQVPINMEVKIDEAPDLLRHACSYAGVSKLSVNHFYVPEMGIDIPFYFCMACGKLFYYRDFM